MNDYLDVKSAVINVSSSDTMSISGLTSTIKNPLPFAEGIAKHHQCFPSWIAILITNTALTKRCSLLNKTTPRKLAAIWREMLPLLACMFLGPFESQGECNLSAAVLV
jgi:hypothetical protein